MTSLATFMLALSLSIGTLGCKKKEEHKASPPVAGSATAGSGSGSAASAGSGSATAGSGSGSADGTGSAVGSAAGSGSADGSGSATAAADTWARLLAQAQSFKDRACSCKDGNCAAVVMNEVVTWGHNNKDVRNAGLPSKEVADKIGVLETETETCLESFGYKLPNP